MAHSIELLLSVDPGQSLWCVVESRVLLLTWIPELLLRCLNAMDGLLAGIMWWGDLPK